MYTKLNHQQCHWLITGGAGFIGSHFVQMLMQQGDAEHSNTPIIVLDAMKYSAHPDNLPKNDAVHLVKGDINDQALVMELLQKHHITHVVNFAAESHVDNSIHSSADFIQSNINGTHRLLEAARCYIEADAPKHFRYVQVSTDEVFGSLSEGDAAFTEESSIAPSSPYSASKAAADALVLAWHHTYGLPTLTTHCSNNYGSRQHPEKLIPHMITQALAGERLPVYGDGRNIRDWIHVQDHCLGVYLAAMQGKIGQRYCFGGRCERRNIDIVHQICQHLDALAPRDDNQSYSKQIAFVTDRLGHDKRYAINDDKAIQELGFKRHYDFEQGLQETVQWYLNNSDWLDKCHKANI